MSPLEIAVIVGYVAVLLVLSAYGSHRYYMAYLYYRHKFRLPTPLRRFDALPRVTVQLPIFNEMYVVNRLIGAVCALDYPRHLLEIQVLDDSIDETSALVEAHVERLRERGIDAVYIHRVDRTGYKAGALDAGLKVAKGELVAIFDADFLPQPEFLRSIV
ncbi:MAG: glycosyltransferase, partial [Anaeromyxobacteraceae bacterium]